MAYGLGSNGGKLLFREDGQSVHPARWGKKNHVVGRLFLEHAIFVSDIMGAIEIACQSQGAVRLLQNDSLGLRLRKKPFQWRVKLPNGKRISVIPDRIFALEHMDKDGLNQRIYYFLEADRGTMPVQRHNLVQTSFRRKLLAYAATWKEGLHRSCLGIDRFRVLTITTIPKRVDSLVAACEQLRFGRGLFLFCDTSILSGDILTAPLRSGTPNQAATLLG